jgi:hypothetical protein
MGIRESDDQRSCQGEGIQKTVSRGGFLADCAKRGGLDRVNSNRHMLTVLVLVSRTETEFEPALVTVSVWLSP